MQVSYLHHKELIEPVTKTDKLWDKLAYYRIANHYQWIFKIMFECFQYPRLIILEANQPTTCCSIIQEHTMLPNFRTHLRSET